MRLLRLIAVSFCLLQAVPAGAQMSLGEPVSTVGPILTLDQNRLYTDSRSGRQTQAEIDAEAKALASENRKLESALEVEETSLVERRANLSAAEFQALAEAFDEKVKDIRKARDAKVRDLAARQDESRRAFLQKVGPVLEQIQTEMGADLILDRSAVIWSSARIDITDMAIARIDAALPAPPPAEAAPADPASGD